MTEKDKDLALRQAISKEIKANEKLLHEEVENQLANEVDLDKVYEECHTNKYLSKWLPDRSRKKKRLTNFGKGLEEEGEGE